MSAIYNFYKAILPSSVRWKIIKRDLSNTIVSYLDSLSKEEFTSDKKVVYDYVKENGVAIFPYNFTKKYRASEIEVFENKENGLKYVMHEGKKLYFKKHWTAKRIRNSYNDLLMEQDTESPHRYLTDDFNIDSNDIIADFGAAEGNFSLEIVDKVKHLYLFETDKRWIVALEETFKPWKDKVTIIQKFVTNFDDDKHVKGDTFFKDKNISFVKIDVDGAESMVLEGIHEYLSTAQPCKLALCTYHKRDDEKEFTETLNRYNFKQTISDGYMIFYHDKKLPSPYLRRALIRASK